MIAIALALSLVSGAPEQGEVHEYVFKNAKAAWFLKTQWQGLDSMMPGIQRAASKTSPPPTGPWVYLDEKRNALVFGSRDDASSWVAKMMAEFDVKPKEVRLTVLVSRPEWGLQAKASITTPNNQPATFGSELMGATVDFRPRLNNDGTVSVIVTLVSFPEKEKATSMVRIDYRGTKFQILDGKASLVKEKALLEREAVVSPPSGSAWKPYRIEVSAVPVDER